MEELKLPRELHRRVISAMPVPPECVTKAQYRKWLKETEGLRNERFSDIETFCEDCDSEWREEKIKAGKCSYFNLFGYFAWGKGKEKT